MPKHMMMGPYNSNNSCVICENVFSCPEDLVIHIKEHAGEDTDTALAPVIYQSVTCSICDTSFPQKHHLEAHMWLHTKDTAKLTCNKCGDTFLKEHDLYFHMSNHINCTVCDQEFTTIVLLNQHMRSHKPFKCSECDLCFALYFDLTVHEKSHIFLQKCTLCPQYLRNAYQLEEHMKTHLYVPEEIAPCPDCNLNVGSHDEWFFEPCKVPHTLVWAKCSRYPYWPGKVLRVNKRPTKVDVRFFGDHKRAWVSIDNTYLLSKASPQVLKRQAPMLAKALIEVRKHIGLLEKQFGSFRYQGKHTPYSSAHDTVCGGTPRTGMANAQLCVAKSTATEESAPTTSLESMHVDKAHSVRQVHGKKHGKNVSYKCYVCARRFRHPLSLQAHLKTHKIQYKCTKCFVSFPHKHNLIAHNRKAHAPLYSCRKVAYV